MPEIAEVHRVVHFIRKHLVGKRVAKVEAEHDVNVFGKVGTSAAEFIKAMKGNRIVGAGQQGKYFWFEMAKPPHPVLHFGMTGWLHVRHQQTYYYKMGGKESSEWPPRFTKFQLTMETGKGEEPVEAAFVDARRFARVRLIDCPAADLRKISPLKENGPDPVIDEELFTLDFLLELCERKRIPIKALMLDQANMSGIGNWVGDEVLYHARIHPEQYSNTLSKAQVTQLHKSIRHICQTACDALADSSKFPEDWLFKHRWGKGKKDSANKLPNGAKIVFVTVGGRTSAVVPSLQKKTGRVAGDVKKEDLEADNESDGDATSSAANGEENGMGKKESKTGSNKKRKRKSELEMASGDEGGEAHSVTKKRRASNMKSEEEHGTESIPKANSASKSKTRVTNKAGEAANGKKRGAGRAAAEQVPETEGRRRSGRLSKA